VPQVEAAFVPMTRHSSIPARTGQADRDDTTHRPDSVLSLLDDEHVQSILAALRDGPRPAQDLVDSCEASRPTVYRRLDDLEDAGVVESRTALRPDGHHRKEFATAVESLSMELEDGSFVVTDATTTPT
jgi:DNA-binding transcriptional ArsR family regulator